MRLLLIISTLLYCRGCHDAEAVTERGPSTAAPYDPEAAHQKALKAIEDRRRARDAERAAEFRESERGTDEVERLVAAATAWVVDTYCTKPVERCRAHRGTCPNDDARRNPERACRINQRGAEKIMRDRDVRGLTWLIRDEVERRHREGLWVPLSREKAPAFLLSIAFHEGSWRWRHNVEGSRGERCTFQVMETNARKAGFTIRQVASDPLACLSSAIETMRRSEEECGAGAERWMGMYASGHCGWAREVVDERFDTARFLLAEAQRAPQGTLAGRQDIRSADGFGGGRAGTP
jgi:hypothetical protein